MKKIALITYHYPPDISAGAKRSNEIIKSLLRNKMPIKLKVICSRPIRYGSNKKKLSYKDYQNKNLTITRLWVPFLGNNFFHSVISYLIFFVQAIFVTVLFRPNIVIGTSAKLLTCLVSSITAKLSRAKLFLDIRDTFTDNF